MMATIQTDLTIYIFNLISHPALPAALSIPFSSLLTQQSEKPTGHQHFTLQITVFTPLNDTHILLSLS
jgi:hypothetical protein